MIRLSPHVHDFINAARVGHNRFQSCEVIDRIRIEPKQI